MRNTEKLRKLISGQSNWLEEAKWREANEGWLSISFEIALRVLGALKSKSMTQKDLAEKMNVTPQFISKILKGEENLSLETISKLTNSLGIRLVEVPTDMSRVEVKYDLEQAYEVVEASRREFFAKTSTERVVEDMQVYSSGQEFQYKIPA